MGRRNANSTLVVYVGTRRLAGFLADVEGRDVEIVKTAEIPSAEGFKKGDVAQLDRAVASVGELFKQLGHAENDLQIPTYVLISSPHLKTCRFSSSVYYSGYPKVVTSREVRQVIDQTRNSAPLSLEDWILQVIPESFWVDDIKGVEDPIGLEAQRLAVTLQIFTANYASVRNLSRVFETLECNVKGYYPKTLVLPEGLLTEEEKQGESLVIDLIDEATHLVLSREGKIIEARSLDLGNRFLTEKVADAWQLSFKDAERLKEQFGSLQESIEYGEELIPLVERNSHGNHQIKRAEFHRTFFSLGKQFFGLLEKEIKEMLKREKIGHPFFVLTGGGAKLEGALEFLSRELGSEVRLGTAHKVKASSEILRDPVWAAPVGLLHWLLQGEEETELALAKENVLERTFGQFKEWLAAYF